MPDVSLVGPDGPVRLRERIGKILVVYFYPTDETLGCTIQACGFRDRHLQFQTAGAHVIGVSKDDIASHDRFRARFQLPFELLSDPHGAVGQAWGVRSILFELLGGRMTFIFDREGILRHEFETRIRLGRQADQALQIVRDLAKS